MNLFTASNICNNDSYAAYTDWEIEKTSEANQKKWKYNINNPETCWKKIYFNIKVNDNEIDNINNKEAIHPSGDLTDDNNSNIGDYGTKHKQINRNNSFYTLVENKLQPSP